MKEISREDLEKRVEVLEKKVAELEVLIQEQPSVEEVIKKLSISLSKSLDVII